MKHDSVTAMTNSLVQKLLQTLGNPAHVEELEADSVHASEYFEVEVSENNVPQDIIELRQNLFHLQDEVGRYGSLMREIRYLLRV